LSTALQTWGPHCEVLYSYMFLYIVQVHTPRAFAGNNQERCSNTCSLASRNPLPRMCHCTLVQNSFADCTSPHYNVARRTIIWEMGPQSRKFTN